MPSQAEGVFHIVLLDKEDELKRHSQPDYNSPTGCLECFQETILLFVCVAQK